ncbi:hypothetical protein FE257_005157 [Aspergillus nanangensis]|uniref:Integral membrane protein n=1 Tax=Aspergillus nanangensis TaxID=2582783 RepID=A0AAD4CAC8_ASPNN|nr:hypothetical protein FE257_005157 [Aspergillus nanangensis]
MTSVVLRSASRYLSLLLIALVCLSVQAQNTNADTTLIPTAASKIFPQCGITCPLLTQAQTGCIPPSALANGRATYVSCFCQSSLITQLHSSADGTCDDTCTSASDRSLLKKWYTDFCASGGDIKTTSTTTTNTNNQNDQNNQQDSNQANQNDNAAATTTASARKNTPPPPSWWSGHYKWVIMVIVLIVGFALIAVLGVWLKRRHDAKYPNLYHSASGSANNSGLLFARQNNLAPPPVAWASKASPQVDSAGSSSRTEVFVPKDRPSRSTTRLQKNVTPTQGDDDLEIREVPR